MANVTSLDVQVTPGINEAPELSSLSRTMQKLGTTLSGLDEAMASRGEARPIWIVTDLSHRDGLFVITLSARASPNRDQDSLLRPVEALVDGVRHLEDNNALPAFYGEDTISRLLEVATPTTGIRKVSLATLNGRRSDWVPLSDRVVAHAKESVFGTHQAIGSVTGVLDVLSRGRRRGSTIRVYDERTHRRVTVNVGADVSDTALRAAWGQRVTLRGRITRNSRGQAINVRANRLELLPTDDQSLPRGSDLLGAAPDWTGSLDPDEFVRQRNRHV